MLARRMAHLAPPAGPPGPPPAAQGTAARWGEWCLCSASGSVALVAGAVAQPCCSTPHPPPPPQYSVGNVFGVQRRLKNVGCSCFPLP